MWFKYFQPKQNSKAQQLKAKKTVNVVGCNKCHRTDVTLIKCTDSYYCKECITKKYNKKGK